jgi:hypothetical protein
MTSGLKHLAQALAFNHRGAGFYCDGELSAAVTSVIGPVDMSAVASVRSPDHGPLRRNPS